MNASSKQNSHFEDQATSVLDLFPQKIYSLNSLEIKLGAEFLSKFKKEFTSYREFSLQDPNCLFKILIFGNIEFLLTICENANDFELALRNFGTVNYMIHCQGGCKQQLSEKEVLATQKALVESLFASKVNNPDIGETIQNLYTIVACDPKVSRVIALMGRGLVYEFLNGDSKELDTIKQRSKVDLKTFLSTICSYSEDFNNRNRTLLDVLCAMSGRNLIINYSNSQQEVKYPTFLTSSSSFNEFVIFHEDMIYWLRTSMNPLTTMATQPHEEETKSDETTRSMMSTLSASSKVDRSHIPKKMKLSSLPKHLGDETGDEDIFSTEFNCKNCISVLNKCIRLRAMYCESCKLFFCDDCTMPFNESKTCRCQRCVCCFMEYCQSMVIIGIECQTMCHQCHEVNDPSTYNIVRYKCGHGYCRICMFENTVHRKHDPRFCFLCRK